MDNSRALVRRVNSIGEPLWLRAEWTPGEPTPDDRLLRAPAVIASLLYRAPSQLNGRESLLDEYVELVNAHTTETVQLWSEGFRGAAYYNTWRLRSDDGFGRASGPSFDFPRNVSLAPRERLLIVGDEPDAFRSRHSLPASLQILGPWSGTSLPNDGARVRLLFPDAQNADFTVPYVIADQLHYAARAPWPPLTAAQLGRPLQRIDADQPGNEPNNWQFAATSYVSGAATTLSNSVAGKVALGAMILRFWL
eukprot:TRINITY_DN11_c0_g2_i1.p3 TRINITY_DN11_c0_g2~~TRINITY_DN11_c0_g2_i1.p3  ORF type:complete len:251 (-),score=125.57 TRINITY_DN11_c0_g2_i1:21-773(-)